MRRFTAIDVSAGGPGRSRGPDDEYTLVLAARDGGRADRERLVEKFLPAIAAIARRYHSCPAVDRTELMQDGVVGLLRALERYDPSSPAPFWAYASWWIRQAMQQLVAELGQPIVLSDRALRQLARCKRAERDHAQAHGRQPTLSELSEATGLDAQQIGRLRAAERPSRGFDEPVTAEEGGITLAELLADPATDDPSEGAWSRVAVAELPAALERLEPRERAIVSSRYGLDGPSRTLAELGTELGVSAERVRQIEGSALQTLRAVAGQLAPARAAKVPA
jgi:RNA polymerase primary sigma factor